MAQISEGLRKQFKDKMAGKPAEKNEEKKDAKEPEKKAKEAKEPEKAAAEPEKKEPEKKPVRVSRKAVVDQEGMVARAASAAAKAAVEAAVIKKPGEPPKPSIESDIERLPDEYKRDVKILQKMEEMLPEKYKGKSDEFIRKAIKADEYARKWETANPGQEFDKDAEEHNAFFEKNDVNWDDDDFENAKDELRIGPKLAKERERIDKQLEEMRTKDLQREIEPVISQKKASVARHVIAEIDKDFVGMVDQDGRINKPELDKLRGIDEVKTDAILLAANQAAKFVDTVERIFHPTGKFKFDEKNGDHVAVAQFLIEQEDKILGSDEQVQLDNSGRQFVTRAQYGELSPAQKRNYWCLTPDDLVYLKTLEAKLMAKDTIKTEEERLSRIAEARGWKLKSGDEQEPEKKDKPVVKAKPDSPSGGEGVKVDPPSKEPVKATDGFSNRLKAVLRGQKVS